MTALDRKRKQNEVLRLQASLGESEMRIMEREDEILKITKTVKEQQARIDELTAELETIGD